MSFPLKVVIPSRGRTETIGRNTLALMPYATVTVDEREVDDYAEVMPREQILPHPPLPGMVEILNWIFDNCPAKYLVVAFDDLADVRNLVGWRARRYVEPDVIRHLLEVTATCADDVGAKMFGFGNNQSKPFYPHFKPLKFNGYTRNVMGFVEGHGLRWDPYARLHGDVDISLQSLQQHRIIYRDDRWVFTDAPMASNAGGQVGRRSKVAMEQADARLIRKWGRKYVRVETRKALKNDHQARTQATIVTVPRRDPAVFR